MPDTTYPFTKDILREGIWVQKRNKQGVVLKVENRYHHMVYGLKATVEWSHYNNRRMKLHTSIVDSKYLKPIKSLYG